MDSKVSSFSARVWLLAFVTGLSACGGCRGCNCGGLGGGNQGAPDAQAASEARTKAEAARMSAKLAQDRQNAPPMDVMSFIQEFADKPGNAREKYEDQMYKVTGKVHSVDGPRVLIHDRNGAVQCVLPPEQAASLTVGEWAAVTGVVTTGSGHIAVRLNSCELMAHGSTSAAPVDADAK